MTHIIVTDKTTLTNKGINDERKARCECCSYDIASSDFRSVWKSWSWIRNWRIVRFRLLNRRSVENRATGQLIIEGICNFCGGPSHGNYTRVGIGIAIIRSIISYGAFFLTLPELSNFFLTYKHVGRRDVYDDTEIFLRMRDMRVVTRILPDVVIIDPTDQDSVYVDVTLEGQIQVANSYLEEWRNL